MNDALISEERWNVVPGRDARQMFALPDACQFKKISANETVDSASETVP